MVSALTLTDIAARLRMSPSWLQKNWRHVDGLPAPFIGGGKGQHPRWRPGDIDRFLQGDTAPATRETPAAAPPLATSGDHLQPANPVHPRFPALPDLLRLAG